MKHRQQTWGGAVAVRGGRRLYWGSAIKEKARSYRSGLVFILSRWRGAGWGRSKGA